MFYTIYSQDAEGTLETRLSTRPAHLERLKALVEQGRLLVAGPNPAIDSEDPGAAGFSGSLIIAEFQSLEEAKSWADADPYVAAGVYEKVEVKPYKKYYPDLYLRRLDTTLFAKFPITRQTAPKPSQKDSLLNLDSVKTKFCPRQLQI